MTARALALLGLADALADLRRRATTPSAVADLANLAATARRVANRFAH